MPPSEEEIRQRCKKMFNDPLDFDRRARLASLIETIEEAHLQVLNILEDRYEPVSYISILKENHHVR